MIRTTIPLLVLLIALGAPAVAAPNDATVLAVTAGAGNIQFVVAIPKHIDDAARNRNVNYGLDVTVTYVSVIGSVETLDSGPVSIKLDTQLLSIDKNTAVIQLIVPLGTTPAPGGNPSYSPTAQLLRP